MCATTATGYPREHKTLFDIPLLLSMYVESLLKKNYAHIVSQAYSNHLVLLGYTKVLFEIVGRTIGIRKAPTTTAAAENSQRSHIFSNTNKG